MIPSNKMALTIANRVSGLNAMHAEFLYDGATSRAWKVNHENINMIVRMARSNTGRPITYQSECEIFKQLKHRDVPVPEVLATYKDSQIEEIPTPWAVTQSVPGRALKDGKFTDNVAYELGQALSIIHSLPVTNFGRLEERESGIHGKQNTPLQGILARWCF